MKKIILTESQLKKLVTRHKLSENLDMEDDGMKIPVKMALFSHLSDIQEMTSDEKVNDLIKFVKVLIEKHPDTREEIPTIELDMIYDEMLGMSDEDKKNPPIDDNPFPDGYDLSMNESVEKIKTNFDRFIK
jgi:hypothetical protein